MILNSPECFVQVHSQNLVQTVWLNYISLEIELYQFDQNFKFNSLKWDYIGGNARNQLLFLTQKGSLKIK